MSDNCMQAITLHGIAVSANNWPTSIIFVCMSCSKYWPHRLFVLLFRNHVPIACGIDSPHTGSLKFDNNIYARNQKNKSTGLLNYKVGDMYTRMSSSRPHILFVLPVILLFLSLFSKFILLKPSFLKSIVSLHRHGLIVVLYCSLIFRTNISKHRVYCFLTTQLPRSRPLE